MIHLHIQNLKFYSVQMKCYILQLQVSMNFLLAHQQKWPFPSITAAHSFVISFINVVISVSVVFVVLKIAVAVACRASCAAYSKSCLITVCKHAVCKRRALFYDIKSKPVVDAFHRSFTGVLYKHVSVYSLYPFSLSLFNPNPHRL